MMIKQSLMIMVCFSVATLLLGQTTTSNGKTPDKKTVVKKVDKQKTGAAEKRVSNTNNLNTLLYEISGKGLEAPSYLFGTMHILCADDAKLSPAMKKIIKETGQVYFEIDMDNLQEMMGALQYLRMNDGKQLSDLLTEEEYDRVKKYFEKNKTMLPFSMMSRFKPYFISSLIGEQMMTCEKKNGMETLIMSESRQYDKEIRGLETTKFQAGIFDSIPYDKQAKDLVNYIDSIDNYKDITEQLVVTYRDQNLQQLDSLMHKSDPGMEQYMGLLLYDRNKNWVKQMPAIMAAKPTLFAVGAGHLPGEQGVIKLLRKAGYTVKPVAN
jgi:uncharacterized protein YbaP (TraB family)